MSSRINLIFGAGSFGLPGPHSNGARIHSVEQARETISVYVHHGYTTIDTARLYGGGTSEEFIGQVDIAEGCYIDTKALSSKPGDLSPKNLRASLMESLKALRWQKVHIFYLHSPDRSVPIEDTLRAINEFYNEGHFEQFGLSNYNSWEVAEIMGIVKQNNWVKPTVYQGGYNAVERNVEVELIPCLRHFGIKFYAYGPLAGGLLVGKILDEDSMKNAKGGRWDPSVSHFAPTLYEQCGPLLPILRELKELLDVHNIRMAEAAQRWLQHHSALQPGDAVILGAASPQQMEDNIVQCEGGPLPDEIVKLLDETWKKAKAVAPHYAL
ncbi:NADP-dependent oxidoreductase domain-containing protein [Suillus clintonianus]|uniref:NADP-dependent oxidoreductase domain-containing protein n=1 Tax=Suillus clintonianus TaxID=1904413 RepID=UPI001B869595|nr:NADP-dependent oxidoreductase domain-containing protein [Suillus clintonianus]KAG2139307.1 NADP-dependent oxidoreductase domain-containing protein [Suillus clintonianus]